MANVDRPILISVAQYMAELESGSMPIFDVIDAAHRLGADGVELRREVWPQQAAESCLCTISSPPWITYHNRSCIALNFVVEVIQKAGSSKVWLIYRQEGIKRVGRSDQFANC